MMEKVTVTVIIAMGLVFLLRSEGHWMPITMGVFLILAGIAASFGDDNKPDE